MDSGLVGTFNQEKALVGAFSVIVKSSQEYLRTAEKLQMTGDVCSPHVTLCWCRLQWAGCCGGCEVARGGVTYRPQSHTSQAQSTASCLPTTIPCSGVDSDTVCCAYQVPS